MARQKQDPLVAKKKQGLYNKALTVLKGRRPEEFEEILVEEYAKEGLEYSRRLTAQERAAKEAEEKRARAKARLAKTLAEFPDLVEEFSPVTGGVEDSPAERSA